MKTINIFLVVALGCFCFVSCQKPIYHNIPDDYKKACGYYALREKDTIKLLKNNTDTLFFLVNKIDLFYYKVPHKNDYVQVLNIRLVHKSHFYYKISSYINGYSNNVTSIPSKEPYINFVTPDIDITGVLEKSNYSDTIKGIYYTNLYKITDGNSFIITSLTNGVVWAQSENTKYEII